jgi:single-strand DNA-binding protein
MASVNKAILVGNLGFDPEIRYMASGDPVCSLRLATTDNWKDKTSGERKEATEWHRVVMYRKLAEIAGQYLKKGSQVYIEGKIKTRKWQDKEGQERYTTEIEASEMVMLGRREGSGDASSGGGYESRSGHGGGRNASAGTRDMPASNGASQGNKKPAFDDFGDDDIPF